MTSLHSTARTFLDLFALPPPLTVAEWAEEYRFLSSEGSSKPGKWHSMPWQIAPMADVTDPDVESITLMWAAQIGGKTEVINNTIGYFIDHDPSPILMLQPTVEMAESWSKEKFAPMLRDTRQIRGKVRDARSRDANNTILHKGFPGGHLTIVGTNAPSGLAARSIKVLVCDEVDRYEATAGKGLLKEGDPIKLAEKRTESFWDAVKIYTSTPKLKGVSRIESLFELTDKNFFWVPCPECGEFQTLKWGRVQWPKEVIDGKKVHKIEEAFYECEHCSAHWTDEMRQAAIWKGEWRPSAPFKGKRGYHLNGIYVLFKKGKGVRNRLHQMARDFLEAQGSRETRQTFVNTFLAETWEEEGEKPDLIEVMGRAEVYGPKLPAGVLALVAGGDMQKDRLEGLIIGIGLGWEIWCIEAVRLYGAIEQEKVWQAFDQFLDQEFEHPSGVKLRVVRAFIDSGHKPEAVYRFCKPRHGRGVYAVKGATTPGQPLCGLPRTWGALKCTGFLIGTDTAKSIIYDRLKILNPGPKCIHFPVGSGFDQDFFRQLTSEKLTTEFRHGFPHKVWVLENGQNNEALDMFGYALAAGENLRPALGVLAKSLAIKAEPVISKPDESAAETKAEPPVVLPVKQSVRPPVRRKTGWVNKW